LREPGKLINRTLPNLNTYQAKKIMELKKYRVDDYFLDANDANHLYQSCTDMNT